jgi:hypothetical protein
VEQNRPLLSELDSVLTDETKALLKIFGNLQTLKNEVLGDGINHTTSLKFQISEFVENFKVVEIYQSGPVLQKI